MTQWDITSGCASLSPQAAPAAPRPRTGAQTASAPERRAGKWCGPQRSEDTVPGPERTARCRRPSGRAPARKAATAAGGGKRSAQGAPATGGDRDRSGFGASASEWRYERRARAEGIAQSQHLPVRPKRHGRSPDGGEATRRRLPPCAGPSPRQRRPPLRVAGRHRGGGWRFWGWLRARDRRRRPRTSAGVVPGGAAGWNLTGGLQRPPRRR